MIITETILAENSRDSGEPFYYYEAFYSITTSRSTYNAKNTGEVGADERDHVNRSANVGSRKSTLRHLSHRRDAADVHTTWHDVDGSQLLRLSSRGIRKRRGQSHVRIYVYIHTHIFRTRRCNDFPLGLQNARQRERIGNA